MEPAVTDVHKCRMFGTTEIWTIPVELRDVPKSSSAYRLWYKNMWNMTRRNLAGRGNIKACLSIKKNNERIHIWHARQQNYRRALAQEIARGENANPWGALRNLAEENLD